MCVHVSMCSRSHVCVYVQRRNASTSTTGDVRTAQGFPRWNNTGDFNNLFSDDFPARQLALQVSARQIGQASLYTVIGSKSKFSLMMDR